MTIDSLLKTIFIQSVFYLPVSASESMKTIGPKLATMS